MTEENFTNEITYDDGWQSASCPEYSTPAHTETEEESPQNTELPPQKRKKSHNTQVLVTMQLIICLLLALAAFIIKTVGGDFYAAARQWYYGELNKSIIAENTPDDYNLSEIFGTATDDEV